MKLSLVGGFILVLGAPLAGCSEPERPPNVKRTQPDEKPAPEPRPIETRRLDLGSTKVDATVQEPPSLAGVAVEITTWASEVVRGRLVSEEPDAYVIDTGPDDGSNPKLRRVPRAAVMEIRRARRTP